jgi:hypothetical protein
MCGPQPAHASACAAHLLASWLGVVSAAKAYYFMFPNVRFIYIALELSKLLSNVVRSTSWYLRVSQNRAVQRVTEIRNDLALLSDSMANLMCSGPTTSRARVQRMPSVLGAPVPSEAAAACRGRGGGRGSRKDLAMKNEN